jgi:hypothetical protein
MKIEVAIDGDGQDHRIFEWHGDGTTIDDLAVGESKTITDDDGNEIMLKRTEKGLEIEVEGETIDIAGLDEDHELHAMDDVVVKTHADHRVKVIKTDGEMGVTIISSDALDDKTRARLEEVLKEAGKDGEIMFIDGSELGGEEQAGTRREIRVIRKKVDVTN